MSSKDHAEPHHKNPPAHGKSEEVRLPRAEYEQLLNRLKELEGVREKLLLSAADFDNAKKRLARERDEFVRFSQENLIRHLLPVLDNFERALAHAGASPASEGLVAGIQLVFKQLAEILKRQGLTRLVTVGQRLDPHRHEVVGHVPQEGPEDEIVEEVEAGYLLHDRLLRAAKVRVRVSPSSEDATPRAVGEKEEEIT